jgi:hypothetical protein
VDFVRLPRVEVTGLFRSRVECCQFDAEVVRLLRDLVDQHGHILTPRDQLLELIDVLRVERDTARQVLAVARDLRAPRIVLHLERRIDRAEIDS